MTFFIGPTKQRGFTLLEVMVAVAIFAIAGGAIVKAASEHLSSVSLLKNTTVATWVANNQITEAVLLSKRQWPVKNNLSGESKMNERTWYWLQTVSKTPTNGLSQVTVTVFDDAQRQDAITSVSTFVVKESI
ncbi:type II secretion system minor pseudopilin GspI [Agaribacter marinus]|uniref:Type II secretion system protein I n=1 Tax=Agaribacter marinus TaxID=1431249 RepID=A0AA37WKY6_9ALTE|nr:type II secretion system minor pseudopilin GspI [Agaribacter marinus]GLR71450.1 type II secretion system protein GspI [Agaribacter marinus]